MGLPMVRLAPVAVAATVAVVADGEPELEAETGAVIRLDDDMAILMLFIFSLQSVVSLRFSFLLSLFSLSLFYSICESECVSSL